VHVIIVVAGIVQH